MGAHSRRPFARHPRGGFRELYYQQSIQSGAPNGRVTNPYTLVPNDEAFILLTGAPDLRPELAHTNTFGVVFSPLEWAEGLQFSVDYYEIELKEGIQRGSSQLVANNCATATGPNPTPEQWAALCPLVAFGPSGAVVGDNVTSVLAPYYNDLPYEASGVDFGGNYSFDIGYSSGALTITTQGRYTDEGKIDLVSPRRDPSDPLYNPGLINSIVDNTIPSHFTQNVTASYDFMVRDTEKELWMSVNNIWDKDPPFSAGGTGGVNGIYYDTMGRMYRVGVRLSF